MKQIFRPFIEYLKFLAESFKILEIVNNMSTKTETPFNTRNNYAATTTGNVTNKIGVGKTKIFS